MIARLLTLTALLVLPASAGLFREDETPGERQQRMAWWRDAKFGMFVHWGIYAAAEGRWKGTAHPAMRPGIEWLMCKGGPGPGGGGIPVDEYVATLAPKMTLEHFQPAEWAALAREAGMRYFVITAKHHDGFGMVDFPGSHHDIAGRTPRAMDPMPELARAMRSEGLRFGFYFSQSQDWSKPGGRPTWFKGLEGDWTRYAVEHAAPQLRHLLGGTYGKIDLLWFDSGGMTRTREGAEAIWQELAVAPEIIVNNRLKQGFEGDFGTPEQWVPPVVQGDQPWETCMTLNGSWGYNPTDPEWKSAAELIRTLCEVTGRGGNLLLNVGPRADGSWEPQVEPRLRAIGHWLDAHGEAIYGTRANPIGLQRWGEMTVKRDGEVWALYGMITRWPEGGRLLLPLEQDPVGIRWIGSDADAPRWQRDEDGLEVLLENSTPPDPRVSVFRVDLDEPPAALPRVIRPEASGAIRFAAGEASTRGGAGLHWRRPHLVGWSGPRSSGAGASWQFRSGEPAGEYRLDLSYGCHPVDPDSIATARLVVEIDGRELELPLEVTGSEPDPHNPERRTVRIKSSRAEGSFVLMPGRHELKLSVRGAAQSSGRPTRQQLRDGFGESAEVLDITLVPAEIE